MPHPMIMTVWSMHWRLVSRCCLITRSYLENLFLFLNLVSKTFYTFWNVDLPKIGHSPTDHTDGLTLQERMSSCHHLLIICEILRVVALFCKPCVVSVHHNDFSLVSRSVSCTRLSNRRDGGMGTSDVPAIISCVRWAVLFNWCQTSDDQSHSTRAGSSGESRWLAIWFPKILKNKQHHLKVVCDSFSVNGHTLRFCPQT